MLIYGLIVSCLSFYGCATMDAENINRAEAHYKLGVSYMSKGEIKDAFIEFQKTINIDPKHKEALNSLGIISARFKKYDDAISYYNRAISLDPNYSEAMNNLGVVYLELEKWDDARRYFKMATENPLYMTPEKAYSNMAFAYYKKGDYKSAEDAVNEALIRSPNFSFALYISGLIHVATGDDELAIKDLNKVLGIVPDHIDTHWEIAHAYLRIGERDKAVEHFRFIARNAEDKKLVKEANEYIDLLSK
ncbi:MAG: hypothetical protein Fur0020_07780 [Thermodesulfovibrionia bacterium]